MLISLNRVLLEQLSVKLDIYGGTVILFAVFAGFLPTTKSDLAILRLPRLVWTFYFGIMAKIGSVDYKAVCHCIKNQFTGFVPDFGFNKEQFSRPFERNCD